MSRAVPRKIPTWLVIVVMAVIIFFAFALIANALGAKKGKAGQNSYDLPDEYASQSRTLDENLDKLSFHLLDVGQGDCGLLELPDGKLILVDLGDKDAGPKVGKWLAQSGFTNIFCLIATHPHADHIGGFKEILEVINTKTAYFPGELTGATAATSTYRNFLKALLKKDIVVEDAYAGDYILSNAVYCVRVLAPQKHAYENLNNTSVCLLVSYGDHLLLLTGDAEGESEAEMIRDYRDDLRRVTLLKVGHHGSKTSSTESFLRIVEPDVAFISLGKDNPYHHPHPSLMKRLLKWCGAVYRTDEEGSLTFITDGSEFEVKTAR